MAIDRAVVFHFSNASLQLTDERTEKQMNDGVDRRATHGNGLLIFLVYCDQVLCGVPSSVCVRCRQAGRSDHKRKHQIVSPVVIS